MMRILIATDAWHPQVNGVVRTLTSLSRAAANLGAQIEFLTPDGFPSVPVPTYQSLRVAIPNRGEIARRIEAAAPDAIHIATEGPIGWSVRGYCRRHRLPFTTSYTTRFPEYIAVRSIIPASVTYAVLRHFHSAAAMTMVATGSLHNELSARGFRKLGFWGRGVDTAIEAVGVPASFITCEDIVAAGGVIANVGVHGIKADLHLERLWDRNITITTRLVDTVTTPMLLKTVQSHKIAATKLITHRFKFGNILRSI